MQIKFKETTENGDIFSDLEINPHDVKVAKESMAAFLETLKTKTDRIGEPQLYYISLLVMHIMSEQILNETGAERLKEIFAENRIM